MNLRQPLLRLCTTGCGLLVVLSLVLPPQAARASIDSKIKTSLSADQGAESAAISLEVKTRAADLGANDPAKRSAAREDLIIQVNAPGGTSYSSAFLDSYAKELNTELTPLVDNKQPVAVRLNAAIVVARVAERVENSYLLPITEKLLNDPSDAVVNWGLKAARYVLPPLLQAGLPKDQQALIADIRAHAKDPLMLRLVYDALSLNFQNAKPNSPNLAKMFSETVPEVLDVLEGRLAEYRKGIPPEPIADFPAPLFLVDNRVWSSVNPAVQLRIVQDLSDLVSLGGHRLGGAAGVQRDQLAALVRQASAAIDALAIAKGATSIQAALQPLIKVDPNDPQLIEKIDAVYPALKADAAWANLKPPPTIEAGTTSAPGDGGIARPLTRIAVSMGRLLVIPLALLALMLAAIGLSGGGNHPRADFTFISARDILTLDTNQMSYLQDFRLAYIIWEGLYSYDGLTLKPIPAVAYQTDVSPDKRVFVFHLRPEAVWNNGDPVTANDFAFAWRRMLESPGEYTYLHYYIKGAEAYLKAYQQYLDDPKNNPKPDFKTVGEEVVDAHTFKVTLTDPVTFFFDLMAFPPFFPLNEKSMQPFAKRDPLTGNVTFDGRFTRPGVVGNGPFILTEWDFKRRVRFEKSKTYWDRADVKSNSIEMLVVEDALGQFLRYEAGDADWLPDVPSEMGPELLKENREDLRLFSGFGSYFLSCMSLPKFKDGQPNPLADMRVRQALAMGFEREPIVKNITRMGETPASTYIPPDIFPGFKVEPGFTFDAAQARKLLAEAGIHGKLPGVRFLVRSSSPAEANMVQSIVNQWKANLGLDVDIELVESKIARQRINDKDYGIAIADWIGDYPDPSTFTDKYRSTSVNNDSGWINLEYDGLLDQAAREADPQARFALLEKANRMLDEQVPIIPLYFITNQYLFRDGVHGINLSPRNMTMLKDVWVDHQSVASAGGKS